MSLFSRLIVIGLPLVPKFIVRRVAKRYVAGETLDDAVRTVKRLQGEGAMCTLDVLGEEVREEAKATRAVESYKELLDAIQRESLDANVSIKPTMLGLKIGEELCRANVDAIFAHAEERGNFVRIDMEDHTCTDATIRLYHAMHARHGNGGIVFQAYLRRLLKDIDGLPEEGANVRLCKGIYVEPRAVAWQAFETVRASFLQGLEKMMRRGVYTAIATHDEHLVHGAMALVDQLGLARERYEFQMLLGVDPELRRLILGAGHRLRVYVPFGEDWYPYSTRRLRENPAIAVHVLKALVGRR